MLNWILISFNLSSDIFLPIIRETVINISSNPSSDILLSRYLYIQYPSGNSSNEFFFTTLFFHDNVTLSALFAIARAFVCVRAGVLAGGTGVESGSQKARPLTLAATHCVFLPAAVAWFLPPSPPSLSSFLSSLVCVASPFSLCYARVSRESSSLPSFGRPAAPANPRRNICRWKYRDDDDDECSFLRYVTNRSAVSISRPRALSFQSKYDQYHGVWGRKRSKLGRILLRRTVINLI